ncbi:MAG TPA: Hsp20/alpha crystallin family protein [Candidatus Polarisedimenticolaceae bacterium]|nr:Hsp20/alpha crystallin family protein [Candidatus Polarisedimenticolaceae bacterium]
MSRDPFAELLFSEPATSVHAQWRPRADVYRTPHGWLVKLDLAGVRPADVTVTLSGSSLTVAGCRRDWLLERDWDHVQMEIAYNCFERRLDLPGEPGSLRVATEFRDGFLLVRVEPER